MVDNADEVVFDDWLEAFHEMRDIHLFSHVEMGRDVDEMHEV